MHTETGSSRAPGSWRLSLAATAALAVAVLGALAVVADRSAHAHRAEARPALAASPAPVAAAPNRSAGADPSLPSALSVFEHRMVLPEELPAQF
jgi:hypothetical protein